MRALTPWRVQDARIAGRAVGTRPTYVGRVPQRVQQ